MATILQADSIDAIDRYIKGATLKTQAAAPLRDAWVKWIDGVSWGDKYFDRATLDKARNKRLEFDLANSTSDAERAEIMRVATTGMTDEETQGDPDRRDSSGHFSEISPLSFGVRAALWGLGAVGLLHLLKRQL